MGVKRLTFRKYIHRAGSAGKSPATTSSFIVSDVPWCLAHSGCSKTTLGSAQLICPVIPTTCFGRLRTPAHAWAVVAGALCQEEAEASPGSAGEKGVSHCPVGHSPQRGRTSLGTTTYLRVPFGTILWSSPRIWPARRRLLCSPRVDYYPLRANGDWQDWARKIGSWSSVHIRAAHHHWALWPALFFRGL